MKLKTATAEPRSLTNRTLWLATAKGAAFVLSFLMPLVLVRRMEQAEFGVYKQSFQILATTLSLLCLQVNTSAYYFMPREPGKKPQIALNLLVFYLAVGSVVAVVFALFPGWVTVVFQSNDLVPIMPLLGLALPLWLISINLESVVIANGDIRWSSAMIVCAQLLKTGLMVGAAITFGSIRALIIAAIVYGTVHCTIFMFYLRRRFGRYWQAFDWPLLKAQLANSLPFGIGGIAYIVQNDLHNYYVSHYFPPTVFAVYAVGCFQLPLLSVLFESVDAVMFPEISRLEREGAREGIIVAWANGMRLLAFFFLPVCGLLLIVHREFITLLFTAKYAAAAPIFAINLLNLLLWISLTGPVMRAFADFRYFRFKLYLLLLPLSWIGLYAGIRTAGLVGAILAVVVVRALDVSVTVTLLGRRLGLSRQSLHYFAPLAKLAGAAAFGAVATLIVKFDLVARSEIVVLAICSVVFGVSYLAAAVLCGAITAKERGYLRDLLFPFLRSAATRNVSEAGAMGD